MKTKRIIKDYVLITLAMLMGAVGWIIFLLPNKIALGGITGIASIIYWGFGIPAQIVFFVLNALLLLVALKVLGWKFCVKTIYGVIVFTLISGFLQELMGDTHLLADQKFMVTIVGGAFLGSSVGIGLAAGGSTGGSDVVAAMIHKYRDVSLGHVILVCDVCIVTSSYLVLRDWEQVLYGYVLLFLESFCVDQVVNSMRQSVQFFIISDKYQEIGRAVNTIGKRGCTMIDARGFYSGREVKMLFVIARKTESSTIFRLIDEIDPGAFVSQSAVIGVYGQGFDRFKRHRGHQEVPLNLDQLNAISS